MSDRPVGAETPRATLTGALEDAKHLAQRAKTEATETAEHVKDRALGLAQEARAQGEEILGSAREQAEDFVEQGKERGAGAASALAQAIHRIGSDLDQGAPEIGRHVHRAADAAEGLAQALRDRSMGELMGDVSAFARRNPTAFFAIAAVAGFALARFLKSAPPAMPRRAQMAPGWVDHDVQEAPRPATMAAATLGGAVAHRANPSGGQPGTMPQSTTTSGGTSNGTSSSGLSAPNIGSSSGSTSPVPNQNSGTPL
ncbi:hypothetical protein [Sabulicella rubraurantiaca]|uniref:hypothetical protein n=1 Tax=Sabulicella rubraurantiaca TaxID=2811429 RepID=UPI001A964201|nr:hypothetical protein [Sabulicella rubraurantiaca]